MYITEGIQRVKEAIAEIEGGDGSKKLNRGRRGCDRGAERVSVVGGVR